MARPFSSLPPSGKDPLQVSLYIGSFKHDPVQYNLFDLVVPASQAPAQHPDEVFFHPRPEILHTFRPEQKVPLKFISAVFTGLVAAPWVVLLGLVRLLSESCGTLCVEGWEVYESLEHTGWGDRRSPVALIVELLGMYSPLHLVYPVTI